MHWTAYSYSPSPDDHLDVSYRQAMNEAQRDQWHARWLHEGLYLLQRRLRILSLKRRGATSLFINQHLLMLLTIDPSLLESLRQRMQTLPPGLTHELVLYCVPSQINDFCKGAPAHDALLATATELARIVNRIDSFKGLLYTTRPPPLYRPSWSLVHGLNSCISNLVLWRPNTFEHCFPSRHSGNSPLLESST